MNAMIVSLLLINIDMSNYKSNIGDASHRIKLSPDGASLVQATLAYVGGNPVSFIDPLGLVTIVVIDNTGLGHMGVLVGDDPTGLNGNRTLYDPGGGYKHKTNDNPTGSSPSGGVFTNNDFSFFDYIQYHIDDSAPNPEVWVYIFDTTPEQEKAMKNKMDTGGSSSGWCAISVRDVLKVTEPFKDIGSFKLPSGGKSAMDVLVEQKKGQRMTGQEYLKQNPVDVGGSGSPVPKSHPDLTILCNPGADGTCPK